MLFARATQSPALLILGTVRNASFTLEVLKSAEPETQACAKPTQSPSWRFLKLATVACQSVTLPHSGLARAALFRLRLRELHEAEDEDTMHDGRWYTMQESPGQRLESLGTPPEVE